MIFLNSFDIDELISPRVSGQVGLEEYYLASLNDFPIEENEKAFPRLRNDKWVICVVEAVITNINYALLITMITAMIIYGCPHSTLRR